MVLLLLLWLLLLVMVEVPFCSREKIDGISFRLMDVLPGLVLRRGVVALGVEVGG